MSRSPSAQAGGGLDVAGDGDELTALGYRSRVGGLFMPNQIARMVHSPEPVASAIAA